MVKWWDRLWGAVWMIGSVVVAYLTARWFAAHAAPADLGGLRYGLIVFAGLFGLLVGAFLLSVATIGITSGIEALFARAGHPFRRPPPIHLGEESGPDEPTETPPATPATPSSTPSSDEGQADAESARAATLTPAETD